MEEPIVVVVGVELLVTKILANQLLAILIRHAGFWSCG